MKNLYRNAVAVLLTLFFIFPAGLSAATEDKSWLNEAEKQIKGWSTLLEKWKASHPSLAEIEETQQAALLTKQRVDDCVETQTKSSASSQEKLDALGEESDDDSEEIIKRRKALKTEKQQVDQDLALCKVLAVNIRELQDQYKPIRNEIVSSTLTHRGEPTWETLTRFVLAPQIFKNDFTLEFQVWPAWLVGLVSFLILFPLSRFGSEMIRRHLAKKAGTEGAVNEKIILNMLAKRLSWVAAFISLALVGIVGQTPWISALMISLLLSMLLAPPMELLLCHDQEKCHDGVPARALLDVVFIAIAMKYADLQSILFDDFYYILLSAYYLLLMIFSLWLMLSLSRRENFKLLNSLRTPIAVAMLAGPVAMWIGYHSLGHYLIPGIYGSLAGILIAWGVLTASSLFFGMFEPDTPQSSKKIREYLGYKNNELVPGLWIGRLLMILTTLVGLLYWMSVSWKVPESEVTIIRSYFTEGFSIGAIQIIPAKLVTGVLVLFILLTLAKWIKNQLSERWLNRTRLDVGAKESIVSLSSYVIVGLSVLIALSMAGVDFQNIAIVAGALSVGIGFGLQNIVNNFVSGLILLFERPVKPGDWVQVGGTEGYVRKVNIRSTLIETFDRSDVLVPNSELISQQLVNWMHRDRLGRVIIPVGVAYGTDVKKVHDILVEIGKKHPQTLNSDWRVPPPKAIFMAFGESSLDFELRCFIREVDQRLNVRSDLLFSINAAFEEAGIEIPFPQRVVHMAPSPAHDKLPDDKDSPDDSGQDHRTQ